MFCFLHINNNFNKCPFHHQLCVFVAIATHCPQTMPTHKLVGKRPSHRVSKIFSHSHMRKKKMKDHCGGGKLLCSRNVEKDMQHQALQSASGNRMKHVGQHAGLFHAFWDTWLWALDHATSTILGLVPHFNWVTQK